MLSVQLILTLLWIDTTGVCLYVFTWLCIDRLQLSPQKISQPSSMFCFTFQGVVIRGWDIAVPTMTVGEISLFTITPDYAYGKDGSGTKIPPNATLQFEIELVCWKGEDVTKDGQVRKITLEKGEGYDKPNTGAACEGKIHVIDCYLHHITL